MVCLLSIVPRVRTRIPNAEHSISFRFKSDEVAEIIALASAHQRATDEMSVQRWLASTAAGETAILLRPSLSPFSRCFNRDGEEMSAK